MAVVRTVRWIALDEETDAKVVADAKKESRSIANKLLVIIKEHYAKL